MIEAKEWDKVCFIHDAAYAGSKDFAKITISEKILGDRSYKISLNSKIDECQRRLASML